MQHSQGHSAMSARLGVLGALAIGAAVLVTYYPLTVVGFFSEDYTALDEVVRLGFPEIITYAFQPCVAAGFCRPAQVGGVWLEYALFGNNAPAFRVVQMAIHLANCLLLYWLVNRVSRNRLVGLLAAMIYAGLPAVSGTFAWFNSPDQATSFFYLSAIVLWLRYLQNGGALEYSLSVGASALALLNKEVGATVPVTLFLADRWLNRKPVKSISLVRRYLLFVLIWAVYGWFAFQRLLAFTSPQYQGQYAGMEIGTNILSNFVTYVITLVLISLVQIPFPVAYVPLFLATLIILYYIVARRSYKVAFVCVAAILTFLPTLPFSFATTRYLYLPIMASAILLASLFDAANRVLTCREAAIIIGATAVSLLVLWNAFAAAETFDGLSAFTRQYRLPMRPLFRRHAQFPENTYLYFVDSPIPNRILSGMISLRYGSGVSVGTTDSGSPAELRQHSNAYVYFFDGGLLTEQAVEPAMRTQVAPMPPVDFTVPIRFEGYEIARSEIKRGETIVAIVYWRAIAPIAKPYTVFAHLVNAKGEMNVGVDGEPRGAKSPTNTWKPDALIVDWVVIPVAGDLAPGDYRLEIGWYDAATMERVSARDSLGREVDRIVIQPFVVE